MNKILITGGAGFIGSHVIRLFVNLFPNDLIINLDALTYAGNLENLKDIENASNYKFEKCNINNIENLRLIFNKYQPNFVIHLAAESHVDRSISNPNAFIETNVMGTANLLNECKRIWKNKTTKKQLFYHISTDEVFGSLGKSGFFTEESHYNPQSPYAASKAASDHLVRSFGNTFNLPFIISNCSNNYGAYQFPEKLIPLCIYNIIHQKPIPVYGDGQQIRDWLFVEDHAKAILEIFKNGKESESYIIGGLNEWTNLDLIKEIIFQLDKKLGRIEGSSLDLIQFVKDRPGHDIRYAIDTSKIKKELKWNPKTGFKNGLSQTIDWYLNNEKWFNNVTSKTYQNYYKNQYDL